MTGPVRPVDVFATWLVDDEGYSRNPARKASRDAATQMTHGPTPLKATRMRKRLIDYRWAWALWDEFCEAHGEVNELPQPPEPAKPKPGRRRRWRREDKRLEEHVSIPPEQWRAFLEHVELDESPPARVIDVMCSTGKRIGDVLRCDASALDRGFAREDGITTIRVKGAKPVVVCVLGGAELEWRRLRETMTAPRMRVCTAVSKRCTDWTAGGAAYQKCRRKLAALAELAGIEGRVHLHRLRRTVAVQALDAGVPLHLVQRMLDHEDIRTTQGYVDEGMARQVADAIAQTRRRGPGA